MKPQHIDPAEAVQVHRDVKAQRSVACHLATFWCGCGGAAPPRRRSCRPPRLFQASYGMHHGATASACVGCAGRAGCGAVPPYAGTGCRLCQLGFNCPPCRRPRLPSLLRSLTDEPMDEPAKKLPIEAQKAGLPADVFVTLRHGSTLVTAGGRTLNQPALLPVSLPVSPGGAAAAVAAAAR